MSDPRDEMAIHEVLAVKATDNSTDVVEKESIVVKHHKKKRSVCATNDYCDGSKETPVSPSSARRKSMPPNGIQQPSCLQPEDEEWTAESEHQDEEPYCSTVLHHDDDDDDDDIKDVRTKQYNNCTDPSDSNSDPQQFVGRRFAKYFPPYSGLFYGTVDTFRYEKDDDDDEEDDDNEDGFLWHVTYTDGDEEECNCQELLEGLDLFEQSTARSPLLLTLLVKEETNKSLWELYSLTTTTNTPSLPSSASRSPSTKKPRGNLSHNNNTKTSKIDPHHPDVLRIQQNQKLPAVIRNNALRVLMFFYFIKERQDMWKRYQCYKQSQTGNGDNAPWMTQDGILRNHNFCNNYRELDRGTQFFHAQMLLRWDAFWNKKKSKVDDMLPPFLLVEWIAEVLWAAYVYRLCNKLESFLPPIVAAATTTNTTGTKRRKKVSETFTFHKIPTLDEWSQFRIFVQQAQKRMGNHQTFFTSAHQNNGFDNYLQGLAALAAHQGQVVRQTANSIFHDAVQEGDVQACVQHVKRLNGCGDFMAWQITCDLMESNALPGCHFDDYCQLGPGAKGR
jgi:alpha-glutamyl/putrescinyl thymine pyrophosphorylase clade 1